MAKRIPKIVQHDWVYHKKGIWVGAQTVDKVWQCSRCKLWTANLPEYKHDVCPKKDRRKNTGRRMEDDIP